MENLNVTGVDSGVVKCPFHPQANSTSLLLPNGQLFVGTATDFSGSDVAILRTGVQSNEVSISLHFVVNLIVYRFVFC